MTEIDLTRDQCAALADYLKKRVEVCHQGYDLIELLMLAQRALRNASKPIGPALVCDMPKMWRQVTAALDKLEGGCEDGRQSE